MTFYKFTRLNCFKKTSSGKKDYTAINKFEREAIIKND